MGGSRFKPLFFPFFSSFFFKRAVSSIPKACSSVTCTLGEDHTAGRQASAPLAVRWPSLCLQRRQIPAGDAADCWPHTQQCRLWIHSFKAALALMPHLIGPDELFAVAAWGPVLLHTSHYLYLIRSLLPLLGCVWCVVAHAVYQHIPLICFTACILDYIHA